MLDSLKKCEPQIYAATRIVAGFLFFWHGAPKLLGFPTASDASGWIIYTAGPVELVGGALVALGLFTRYAAFLSSGLMAVAYFYHVFGLVPDNPGALHFLLPLVNQGELAALYCFVFLYIAAKGNGIWSLGGADR